MGTFSFLKTVKKEQGKKAVKHTKTEATKKKEKQTRHGHNGKSSIKNREENARMTKL